jgi:subtilase family serine protease
MEQAFHVSMQTYQHPTENRTYFAPDVEPSVDAGVAVAGISGLNNYITPRPMSLRHADFNQVQPNATGSQGGQFLGSDIRAAYAPGVTLSGAGQAVGLLEVGAYRTSDITNYFSTIGQPLNVPVINVLLNGVSGVCGNGCDDGEEAVDIQQAIRRHRRHRLGLQRRHQRELGDQVTMATLDVQPTPLPEARNRLTVSVSLWTSA